MEPIKCMDLVKYISDQREWSERTFGPGNRTEGIIDHIKKELVEVEESDPYSLEEWIDIVILALDGAWRSGYGPWQIVEKMKEKQDVNVKRKWPDWRSAEPIKCMDLVKYISDQREWSERTFGPGNRTEGIIDHIKKELVEVEESDPYSLEGWIGIVILALDGAWRSGYGPWQIVEKMREKQGVNIQREWPDWRSAEPGKAIEHIRN